MAAQMPLLNWPNVLDRVGGDTELLKDLIDLFRTDVVRLMHELRDAIARGDAPTTERIAHSIKSTAATFEALSVALLAQEIETYASHGLKGLTNRHQEELAMHVANLVEALAQCPYTAQPSLS